MKQVTLPVAFLLLLLTSCESGTQPATQPKIPAPEKVYTITDFTDTLARQNKGTPGTIENALQLYNTIIPLDSTVADSAASALVLFINSVVSTKNDSLFKSPGYQDLLPNPAAGNLTEQQKAVYSALHANRLKLVHDGEGGMYFVPLFEMILPGIKDKTSAPVDDYLDLKAKEDTTPTLLDAGLAIETEDLADRLTTSEQLLAQQLPLHFKTVATNLNRFYTRAFILGSDNSPSLNRETFFLSEPFKNGYTYLLAKYPSTKAAATVKEWMAVVASGDRKKVEEFKNAFN